MAKAKPNARQKKAPMKKARATKTKTKSKTTPATKKKPRNKYGATQSKAKCKKTQKAKTQTASSDADLDGEERSGSMTIGDCRRFATALQNSTGHKQHAGNLYALAWSLACLTGRRGADVRLLRLSDVKSDRIRIGSSKLAKKKGGRGALKWVPIEPTKATAKLISDTLTECRARGQEDDDKIFEFGYEAFEKKARQVRKDFRPTDKLSCPPNLITSHTPRRSLAGHLFRMGIALTTIKQITGHCSGETLLRYIQADFGYQKLAASKLKF
eukprot:g2071.t1